MLMVILLPKYVVLMVCLLSVKYFVTLVPLMESTIVLNIHHRLHVLILIGGLIHTAAVVID
jgi:hypothetical protein